MILRADREKLNLYIFVDILGHNYEDLHPEQEIQAISTHWNKYSIYIIAYEIFSFQYNK